MDEKLYEPLYRESKALVIGIDSYSNYNLTPLTEAENDAKSIASILEKFDFDVKLLLGPDASKKTILENLYALRDTDYDGRLLIYFACHGYTLIDKFNNEKGYIAVFDTIPEKEFTAVSLDEITDVRFNANAKHIGFIFDTCFSGQALGLTRISQVSAEKFLTRRAYQVISAGAGDQTVADYQSMTQFMVEAIQKGHKENGTLTLTMIGVSLQQSISADTKKTQIPQFGHLKGSQGGDLIISLNNQQKVISFPDNFHPVENSSNIAEKFPKKGIYTAEVDLSGRIDSISKPTVITISAGLSVSVMMSGSDKEEAVQKIKILKPNWGATRINVYIYSTLLYFLLRDVIHKLDTVIIDIEYSGYEPMIKERIMNLLRQSGKSIHKNQIKFERLEKSSPARLMASNIYKGKSIPDYSITAEEILAV